MKGVSASESVGIVRNLLLRNTYGLRHIDLKPRFLNSTIQINIDELLFDLIFTNSDMATVSLTFYSVQYQNRPLWITG